MKKIVLFVITSLLAAALVSGCHSSAKEAQIVATTLPVYEFTSFLCRDTDYQVTQLVNEPVSCLHNYTLQVSQMKTVEAAELLVITGAGYEGFLHDVIHTKDSIIDASTGIELIYSQHSHDHAEHSHEIHKNISSSDHLHNTATSSDADHLHTEQDSADHQHHWDGHIWMSPLNAKIMAQNICSGLSEHYPESADIFSKNLRDLESQLDALYLYGTQTLSDLKCRDLITFHDGFHYLAQSFDLHIIRSIEEEPGSETSASDLIDMISFVRDHELPAVFTEKNGSSASAKIISVETGCSVHSLDMVMYGTGYFESMYHNINTIKEALG